MYQQVMKLGNHAKSWGILWFKLMETISIIIVELLHGNTYGTFADNDIALECAVDCNK